MQKRILFELTCAYTHKRKGENMQTKLHENVGNNCGFGLIYCLVVFVGTIDSR